MTINERVRDARIAAGLTQEQFASLLHVSRSKISMIEDGNRLIKADDVPAIASALGVSCNYLLTGTDSGNRTLADELGLWDETINTLRENKSLVTALNYLSRTGTEEVITKVFTFLFTYYRDPETLLKTENGYERIDDTFIRAFPLMVPSGDNPEYTISIAENDLFEKANFLKLQESILSVKSSLNSFIEENIRKHKEAEGGADDEG